MSKGRVSFVTYAMVYVKFTNYLIVSNIPVIYIIESNSYGG